MSGLHAVTIVEPNMEGLIVFGLMYVVLFWKALEAGRP
jgi:hypothetical protein